MGHLPEDVVTLEQAMEVLVPLLAGWPNGQARAGRGMGMGVGMEGNRRGRAAQGSWDGERV